MTDPGLEFVGGLVELLFIKRTLAVFDEADQHESMYWRFSEDGLLHLYAQCNDLFYWGTSDVEEITPDNLPLLEATLENLQTIEAVRQGPPTSKLMLPLSCLNDLFAARSRGMRPQQPFYKFLTPDLAALFNACGPERDRADEG